MLLPIGSEYVCGSAKFMEWQRLIGNRIAYPRKKVPDARMKLQKKTVKVLQVYK